MRAPSAAELLDIWERGLQQPPAERMLALLGAAHPGSGPGDLAAMPIGRRDALLLELRELLLGPDLTMVASCPGCGEQLESTFRTADLRVSPAIGHQGHQAIEVEGHRVRFRLPASSDLTALSTTTDRDSACRMLLSRCLLDAHGDNGETVDPHALSPHVVAAIAAQMSAADPQADVQINLACPSCKHAWQATFDIASFLWKELHAWARLTLRDVHGLARAYGWREADILALSPTRRQIYLELAQQ
jgi:hypothetical protein